MKKINKKLIRITTVPLSLDKLLEGQLAFMSQYYDITAISSEKEYLQKIGKREGVKTHHIEMSRQITPIKDSIALLKMTLFLIKEKPFIVHTHTPKAGIIGMLAAFIARVPNRIHTVAGLPLLEEKGIKRFILNGVEKLTYACATKVLPNSFGLKQIIFKSKFTANNKLLVLANGSTNGINTSFFDINNISEQVIINWREKLSISTQDFIFIFIGRIVTDKGINELVSAFNGICEKNKKVKLLLVGSLESELDPLLPETLSLISKNKQIISAGYQQDVRPFLAISNCLVFPSYREGFPNVVMQAGAFNLPSIVTNINGCNEIITHGENGFIIPLKNTNALAQAMNEILSDKDKALKMGKIARQNIVEKFEQKVVWKAILDFYNDLN